MPSMGIKNNVRQPKATGEQGRLGHLVNREETETTLNAKAPLESGTTVWLNDLVGSKWDIRYVPVNPLKTGVEA